MDAFLTVASKREVRRYDARPLAEDSTRRILDAGRVAGSASNRQNRRFVVLGDRDAAAEAVYAPDNLRGATLVVAIVVAGKGPLAFDAGRAAQNMMLAAWNEGIGSCPNGVSDPERMREVVGHTPDEQVAPCSPSATPNGHGTPRPGRHRSGSPAPTGARSTRSSSGADASAARRLRSRTGSRRTTTETEPLQGDGLGPVCLHQAQRQCRACPHGVARMLAQLRGDRALVDHRIAPVVQRDPLRKQLGAQPVPGAPDRVDDSFSLTPPSCPRAGGGGWNDPQEGEWPRRA